MGDIMYSCDDTNNEGRMTILVRVRRKPQLETSRVLSAEESVDPTIAALCRGVRKLKNVTKLKRISLESSLCTAVIL